MTNSRSKRNLGKDFSNILGGPLWSAQACLRLSGGGATPHEQRRQQAAALQSAQWTIALVAAGLLRVHLSSSVVSFILLVAAPLRQEFVASNRKTATNSAN